MRTGWVYNPCRQKAGKGAIFLPRPALSLAARGSSLSAHPGAVKQKPLWRAPPQVVSSPPANDEALPPLADKGLIAAPPDVSEKAEEMRTHPESTRDPSSAPQLMNENRTSSNYY